MSSLNVSGIRDRLQTTDTMSVAIIVSRATGFLRTLAQAYALGVTMVASCYSIANNLPNQLYELVIGGVLVTAFLPTYMEAKKNGGKDGASDYASSLFWLIVVTIGGISILAIVFASQLVWTQSFSATSEFDSGLATWFFRFFAGEMLLYSLSSVLSGILNAEHDYLVSVAAPILNNIIVCLGFLAYAIIAPSNPQVALLVIAIVSPLGVVAQTFIQIPFLRRHGGTIMRKPTIRNARLKDTLSLGVPAFVVMVMSFVTVSFMQSSSLAITPEGASASYYARLWYALPYSVFSVPMTMTAFTEMSEDWTNGRYEDASRSIANGIGHQMSLMMPMTALVITFAPYLVSMFGFDGEGLSITTEYLYGIACALPFYAVCIFLQKASSSTHTLTAFAIANVIGGIIQCVICLLVQDGRIWMVAASSIVFYALVDVFTVIYMRRKGIRIDISVIIRHCGKGLLTTICVTVLSVLLLTVFQNVLGITPGQGIVKSIIMCVVAGIVPLVLTLVMDRRIAIR